MPRLHSMFAVSMLLQVTLVGPSASAQAGSPGYGRPQHSSPDQVQREKMERDMAKRANEQRQANLKRDTDELLRLATELKEYVDKTDQNMLSVEVIKKSEQIEKLAHSVRDKMKGYN